MRHIEGMPISLHFLRGVLGALSVLFAWQMGRSAVKVRRGTQKQSVLFTWLLRTAVTLGAVCYRMFDTLSIIVICLDALVFAVGVWRERRPRKQEDLSKAIFPEQ